MRRGLLGDGAGFENGRKGDTGPDGRDEELQAPGPSWRPRGARRV